MQKKVDTKGYIIKGLRKAVKEINKCVKCRELYFIHYDLITNEVSVNIPGGYFATKVLIMESGVYPLTQQELADLIIDKIKPLR